MIDGMEMDVGTTSRRRIWRRSIFIATGSRVRSAALSVRVFGMPEAEGLALAHHLGRALQLTNILRDLDEDAAIDRLYLPREAFIAAGIDEHAIRKRFSPIPRSPQPARRSSPGAKAHFAEAAQIMARCPRASVRAPRLMAKPIGRSSPRLPARGFAPPRTRSGCRSGDSARLAAPRPRSDAANRRPYYRRRRSPDSPRRCGSPDGRATIASTKPRRRRAAAAAPISTRRSRWMIDNGNHLLLVRQSRGAGNSLRLVGSEDQLVGPRRCRIRLHRSCDAASAGTCGPTKVAIPWWILRRNGACRELRARDYLGVLPPSDRRPRARRIKNAMRCQGLV